MKFSKKICKIIAVMLSACILPNIPIVKTNAENTGDKTMIYDLRTESLVNPVGIDSEKPAFSWKMKSDIVGQKQTAYRITVNNKTNTVWDSGKVENDKSVDIEYEGSALASSTEYTWSVTVWDKAGSKISSDEATFETGLLEDDAFEDTKWISLGDGTEWLRLVDKYRVTPTETTNKGYTIDYDFTVVENGITFYFNKTDNENYILWYIGTASDGKIYLTKTIMRNGVSESYDVDITELFGSDVSITNKKIGARLAVNFQKDSNNNILSTDIITSLKIENGEYTQADTHSISETVVLGKFGFASDGRDNVLNIANCSKLYITFNYNLSSANDVVYKNDFNGVKSGFVSNGAEVKTVDGALPIGSENDTQAVFIDEDSDMEILPAYRKEINVGKKLESAKLYTSGLGVYESYINGKRVGRLMEDGTVSYDELKPGYTERYIRKFYNSFDVTWMLNENCCNVLSAVVGESWWSDDISGYDWDNVRRGEEPAYFAKLILTYEDGTQEIINTDASWKAARASALRAATIYNGETYDATIDQSWMLPEFDDSKWKNIRINTEYTDTLRDDGSTTYDGVVCAWIGSPIKVREDLERSAQSLTVYNGSTGASNGYYGKINIVNTYNGGKAVTLNPGETLLVDFGQNFAGWEYLKLKGEKGTTVTITRGEMLNDGNGAISRRNDGPEGSIYNANYRSSEATNRYILSGNNEGESYHPSFTYQAMRYIEITVDKAVTFTCIKGLVVTSAETDTGWIETSDKDVNQLVSNARWGMYSNYLSVPTDCPQRSERLGWTGDALAFTNTGTYLNYSNTFLEKFLIDMRDVQENPLGDRMNYQYGAFPNTAPRTRNYYGGCSAWGDAGILIPYQLYQKYANTGFITEYWSAMEAYMNYLANGTQVYNGVDTRNTYGDWLAYETSDETEKSLISDAYYAWCALAMADMAKAIGNTEKEEHYNNLYGTIKTDFIADFVNDDGTIYGGKQTSCILAIYLDLLPDSSSLQKVTEQLLSNIESNDGCLQTGFVGTQTILYALVKAGRTDVAYSMLLNHNNPSWLYSVDQGATTIWERWNSYSKESGFGPVGMNSFNHFAYGAVVGWMFDTMAGINADTNEPGFKHIIFSPTPNSQLTSVRAEYDSAYGTIVSSYEYDEDMLTYTATLPANTSGTIKLPVEKLNTLLVNGKSYLNITTEADGIEFVEYTDDNVAVFEAVSGSFTFNQGELTLKFDTNGGSEIEPVHMPMGTAITLADYTPTRNGCVFTGWYSDIEFTTKVSSLTLVKNTTVYARWLIGSGETQPDYNNLVYKDDFASDTLSNWESPFGNLNEIASISDDMLHLSTDSKSLANSYTTAVMPVTNNKLNQYARIDFRASSDAAHPVLWIRARKQSIGNKQYLTGYAVVNEITDSSGKETQVYICYIKDGVYKTLKLGTCGPISNTKSGAVYGVGISAVGQSPTVLTVTGYKNGGVAYVQTFTHDFGDLQTKGSVAITAYGGSDSTSVATIDNFSYYSDDDNNGKYYLKETSGKSDGTFFGNYLSVESNKEYEFSVLVSNDYSPNTEPITIAYRNSSADQLVDFTINSNITAEENALYNKYSAVFTPNKCYADGTTGYSTWNADILGSRRLPIAVGFRQCSSDKNNIKYTEFTLREVIRDTNGNITGYGPNLVVNGDFKLGLYGWGDDINKFAYNPTKMCPVDTVNSISYSRGKIYQEIDLFNHYYQFLKSPESVLFGDVNPDGKLNVCDLVRMKKNIDNNNEWDIVSDISSANMYNINRAATDSSIDSRDIVELRKKLLCGSDTLPEDTDDDYSDKLKNILCIGDSLTEGDYGVYGKSGIANVCDKNYPYFLSQMLNVPVINKGKCGSTATSYLNYYLTWTEKYTDVSLIIVMLGTNGGISVDANSQGAKDYDTLICKLKSDYPNSKLVICTAPHATEDETKSNYGYMNNVKLANEFIREYAEKNNITLFDTFSIPEFTAENEDIMQPNDGLHFSEAGYRVLASFIAQRIKDELRDNS